MVLLYHFRSDLFFFGYIGVDIFFVISGYVISISLAQTYKKKNYISIFNFYIARFYRLFPALFFCVLFTSLLLFIFGDLSNFLQNIKTGLAGLFGLANIYLIKVRSSYFGDNLENIFIHLWSLGVEQQFYVLFPMFAVLFFKYKKNNFILCSYLLINLFSLYLFLDDWSFPKLNNFYSPVIRFWEFGVGSIIFFIQYMTSKERKNIFILVLSAVLIAPFIFFDIQISKSFTIISIILSIYLILIKPSFLKSILQNGLLKFFGLISYSMYLWHLPLIHLNKIYDFNIIFLLLLLIFISTISFFYIEKKFRYKHLNDNKNNYSSKILFLVVLLIFCINLIHTNYINKILISLNKEAYSYNYFHKITKNIYSEDLSIFKFSNKLKSYKCASDLFKKNDNCYIKKKSKTLIFITGDSTATNFLSSIDRLNYDFYLANKSGLLYSTILYNKTPSNENKKRKENIFFIKDSIDYFNKISANYENSFFVISSHYLHYESIDNIYDINYNKEIKKENYNQYIEESISKIRNIVNKKSEIIIVNNIFFEKGNVNLCMYLFARNKKKYNQSCVKKIEKYKLVNKKTIKKINSLEKKIPSLIVFNQFEHLCPQGSCGMVLGGSSVLEDSIHLSPIVGYLYLSKKFNQLISNQINSNN